MRIFWVETKIYTISYIYNFLYIQFHIFPIKGSMKPTNRDCMPVQSKGGDCPSTIIVSFWTLFSPDNGGARAGVKNLDTSTLC